MGEFGGHNGDNWAQAQHVTNSQGSAGSFQTSKGSAGAGFSGANGNSGFVAKDANNNNVYAGADGNVYKKDSNGNWSKYDNGNWTPVDPSTGAAQAKQQKQNSTSPNSLTQSPSKGSSNLGAQSGTPPSAGSGSGSTTPRASGQSPKLSPPSLPPRRLHQETIRWGNYRTIRSLATGETNWNSFRIEEAELALHADRGGSAEGVAAADYFSTAASCPRNSGKICWAAR